VAALEPAPAIAGSLESTSSEQAWVEPGKLTPGV
jgi:hypothetical protein